MRPPRRGGVVQAGGGGEVDVGAAGAQGGRRVEGAGGQVASPVGGGFGGGDVHHDRAGQAVAAVRSPDVGGEGGDQFVLAPGVAGPGAAGPDLRVGGGEFGAYGGREAVRQDAARGECLGAFGQGAVQGVVAAEDEGRQGGQAAVGEGGVSR